MPTKREREYYAMGYRDGRDEELRIRWKEESERGDITRYDRGSDPEYIKGFGRKPKRKLSAWNKYVKANSKKPRFRYRNGKLNLKKMAIAFRKTPAGRKKKR